jgi:hypothetical protein
MATPQAHIHEFHGTGRWDWMLQHQTLRGNGKVAKHPNQNEVMNLEWR